MFLDKQSKACTYLTMFAIFVLPNNFHAIFGKINKFHAKVADTIHGLTKQSMAKIKIVSDIYCFHFGDIVSCRVCMLFYSSGIQTVKTNKWTNDQ